MGTRRRGREAAFQLLYQMDVSKVSWEEAAEAFWSQMSIPKISRDFAKMLIDGVLEHLEGIDVIIAKNSHHWKMHRMNVVDKSILRLGVFELLFCLDIPTKVIINEAIEIGKKYGTNDSGSFINGILDKISKHVREKKEGKDAILNP